MEYRLLAIPKSDCLLIFFGLVAVGPEPKPAKVKAPRFARLLLQGRGNDATCVARRSALVPIHIWKQDMPLLTIQGPAHP